MNRGKELRFFLLCIIIGALAAIGVSCLLQLKKEENREVLSLLEPMVYDRQLVTALEEMQAQQLSCMFFAEQKAGLVVNPDFNTETQVPVLGIAGNSAAYLDASNPLAAGETGYCILGAHTAQQLFGSTRVVGRSVLIGDQTYDIAGITYQRPDICLYELDPEKQELVDALVYSYPDKSVRGMVKQKLMNIYGIVTQP